MRGAECRSVVGDPAAVFRRRYPPFYRTTFTSQISPVRAERYMGIPHGHERCAAERRRHSGICSEPDHAGFVKGVSRATAVMRGRRKRPSVAMDRPVRQSPQGNSLADGDRAGLRRGPFLGWE